MFDNGFIASAVPILHGIDHLHCRSAITVTKRSELHLTAAAVLRPPPSPLLGTDGMATGASRLRGNGSRGLVRPEECWARLP